MSDNRIKHITKNHIARLSAILVLLGMLIFYSLLYSPGTRADNIIFRFNITSSYECFNGIDDDDDGYTDSLDPHCIGPADDRESVIEDVTFDAFLIAYPRTVSVLYSPIFGTQIRFLEIQ
jgi:hypothetical protein